MSQAFAWLARSKHIFRHMNEARFVFTILRLLELRNRDLTRRKPVRRSSAWRRGWECEGGPSQ